MPKLERDYSIAKAIADTHEFAKRLKDKGISYEEFIKDKPCMIISYTGEVQYSLPVAANGSSVHLEKLSD